jgi:hypothetical protein
MSYSINWGLKLGYDLIDDNHTIANAAFVSSVLPVNVCNLYTGRGGNFYTLFDKEYPRYMYSDIPDTILYKSEKRFRDHILKAVIRRFGISNVTPYFKQALCVCFNSYSGQGSVIIEAYFNDLSIDFSFPFSDIASNGADSFLMTKRRASKVIKMCLGIYNDYFVNPLMAGTFSYSYIRYLWNWERKILGIV